MSDGVKGRGAGPGAALPPTRLVLVLSMLACLLAAVAAAAATPAAPKGTWESIVLLYHSDVGGKVEPCG